MRNAAVRQRLRQDAVDVKADALVPDLQADAVVPRIEADVLAVCPGVAVGVREGLLEDPVEDDLDRRGHVGDGRRDGQLDPAAGEFFVLDDQALEDGDQVPLLEFGRGEGTGIAPDTPQGVLDQGPDLGQALGDGFRARPVPVVGARQSLLEGVDLRQGGVHVLDGSVVDV